MSRRAYRNLAYRIDPRLKTTAPAIPNEMTAADFERIGRYYFEPMTALGYLSWREAMMCLTGISATTFWRYRYGNGRIPRRYAKLLQAFIARIRTDPTTAEGAALFAAEQAAIETALDLKTLLT